MDGESVTDEPSNEDGAGDVSPTPMSLTEMFMKLCPQYMAMGMTYDEFWHRNTKVHKAYREAWEQKRAYRNWEMWMQGGYIYEALLKVAPVMRAAFGKGEVKAGKYSEEPYPLSAKEAREREERREREAYKARLERMRASSERELKRRKEAAEKEQEAVEDGRD